MLELVQDFAKRALKDELEGGHYGDDPGEVVDAISDAIGRAREAGSRLFE